MCIVILNECRQSKRKPCCTTGFKYLCFRIEHWNLSGTLGVRLSRQNECLRQPKHQLKSPLANASTWNSLYMSNRNTFRLNWVADSTSQCFIVADNSPSPVLCKNKLVSVHSPISFDRLKASQLPYTHASATFQRVVISRSAGFI